MYVHKYTYIYINYVGIELIDTLDIEHIKHCSENGTSFFCQSQNATFFKNLKLQTKKSQEIAQLLRLFHI